MRKYIPFEGDFPLSLAIVHNHKYTMEISGQIGMNFESKEIEEGIEKQTQRTMLNIRDALQKVGWDLENITKTRIFLKDMTDYEKMNKVYATFFTDNYPARFALAVKELPADALVEIDCTAGGDELKE